MASVNRGKRLRMLPLRDYIKKLQAQLLSHVISNDADGCWIWTGTKQSNGYGQTRLYGKQTPAHRASFFAFNGEIEAGKDVCHSCDTRDCINPSHLFQATHAENMTDMNKKGRGRNGVMSGAFQIARNNKGQITGAIYGK